MVVKRDRQMRIELLRPLIFGDRRGKIVVQKMQIAEIDMTAGAVVKLQRSAVMDGRLRFIAILLLQVAKE